MMQYSIVGFIALTLAVLNPFLYPQPINGEKTAVIVDTFTATAYSKGGFYDYYCTAANRTDGFCQFHLVKCNESCLTKTIDPSSYIGNAQRTLEGLKEQIPNLVILTDQQVSIHPEILMQYDKIILTHNEYVTQSEYTAITHHKNVVYLLPNALYAKVVLDKVENTITLIEGHQYPKANITNGFNWTYDNSQEEYNRNCDNWYFRHVDNGKQLNCWLDTTKPSRFNEILKSL